MPPKLADLSARLSDVTIADEHRLRRRLGKARSTRDARKRALALDRIESDIDAARSRAASRRAALPQIDYPVELPVSARKDDIAAAIEHNQVVIVAGETGSGKTTQLPKICMELGRGVRGMIGHTQPRRIAARAVADRIAEELYVADRDTIAHQIRFTDTSGPDTLVKVMTEGILLTEISSDRMLRRYDTLIIDEAHERSLNIDFILGYLMQVLPKRPDLKVIIMSATIDPQRFSRHFSRFGAPVVEVSGRTYPVEVRYRPLVAEGGSATDTDIVRRDVTEAICDAVHELSTEGPGDVLVFLAGEREIRDAADALSKERLWNAEILPLYGRLSVAEQHRVFAPHTGRRIVLATNVAETSLTVPGIRYVVDPGTARISRYSHRTKVQRLPIEPVSQASANQRKGRCGRITDGICVRLYSEQNFLARPEFTDPEILRTNLASVILQLAALDLGDLASFPFIDGPDARNVKAGVQLLTELGALDSSGGKLTKLGRGLARFPIDPRLARMVIEAERNGCVREVTVVAAALSIQDPRERPTDHQQSADAQHARFASERSDFMALLNLWAYVRSKQRELSSSQFRRMCRREFLNHQRIREWQDICEQLRQIVKAMGISINSEAADETRIHIALLSGLLSHIGVKDVKTREYAGARGTKFAIFPGSALFKRKPDWVMAAELVETSRLWARQVARIEPEWIEPLAGHVVKRSYSQPHWEAKRAAVVANEKVTLYGVPIVTSRKVDYGRIDPELSRELFIRHALVAGDWRTRHTFFHTNRSLLDDVRDLEDKARRGDIVVDDEALFTFYDERVGAEVVSGAHFDSWWKQARKTQPDLLDFSAAMLTTERAGEVSEADYPDRWQHGKLSFDLNYRFDPGSADDGVTTTIPLSLLNQVDVPEFAWQVTGLREELVTALIKSLPKPLRRNFVPAPDHARAVLARIEPGTGDLLESVGRALYELTGVPVERDKWNLDAVPAHLRMTFRVVDDGGSVLAEGKDLAALRERLRPRMRETVAASVGAVERSGLRRWDIGQLPRTVSAGDVKGFPALVDEGEHVAVRVFDTQAQQREAMWAGTRRLLLLTVPTPERAIKRGLSNASKLVLSNNPHGSVAELFADCVDCAIDTIVADAGGPAWDEAGFAALADKVRDALEPTAVEVLERVRRTLSAAIEAERAVDAITARPGSARYASAIADIRRQLRALVHPGFVGATGLAHLADLPRYLRALVRRVDKLPADSVRDAERMAEVHETEREYARRLARYPSEARRLAEVPWMIQELRVSLFAQTLGTAYPISRKRIWRVVEGRS